MYHLRTGGSTMFMHGGDFVFSAVSETAVWVVGELHGRFEMKVSFVGNPTVRKDFDIRTEGNILNRAVRWTEQGFFELGLQDTKGLRRLAKFTIHGK